MGGGVSANLLLRERLAGALVKVKHPDRAWDSGLQAGALPLHFPPMALCMDNAAMIGAAAHFAYLRGVRDDLDMDVEPDLKMGD